MVAAGSEVRRLSDRTIEVHRTVHASLRDSAESWLNGVVTSNRTETHLLLIAPVTTGKAMAEVYLFVDNSNIFISARGVAESREGRFAREAVRLQFENVVALALAGRTMASAYVVGSIPPEERAVWDRLTATTGIVPELYERGSVTGGEQGLDQCLQVHMLRAISDSREPQIAVLLTGDGAGYDTGVGFHADMGRMHNAGWGIEVLSWEASCRRALREWAITNGEFIRLDDYYDSITFLEGGRRSLPLNMTGRRQAVVRPSPVQLAEQRVQQEAEKTIESLKAKLIATQEKAEIKSRRRERHLRRQDRNKR